MCHLPQCFFLMWYYEHIKSLKLIQISCDLSAEDTDVVVFLSLLLLICDFVFSSLFRFAEFHFSIVRRHAEGNVHLDWVDAIEETPLNVKLKPGFGSSNLTSSLNKSGKSQKLNPKRVGAAWAEKRKIELEMEKRESVTNNFDVNWLPNFGRVWQSGSQKESRKEFEVENKNSQKNETQAVTSITNSRCSLTSANEW